MTDVLLFHHALGLTDEVQEFAEHLREGGHRVTTPDLFDGRTFDQVADGVAHVQQLGFATILERGRAAPELIYVGFSLGVLPAQMLAQTRAGARGALLAYACAPVSEFGTTWPAGVPVQIHAMDADPEFVPTGDLEAARELVASTDHAELFLYPGGGHLFTEPGQADYDEAAAELLRGRFHEFLERDWSG